MATPTRRASSGSGGAANRPPAIGAVSASRNEVNYPPCAATSTSVEITAKVTDPDDSPGSLRVRLTYGLNDKYGAEVGMRYDAARGVFAYKLPTITKEVTGGQSGFLQFVVAAYDPDGANPRPSSARSIIVNSCIIIENG